MFGIETMAYAPDPVFGKPMILWGGILTMVLLLATAAIAFLTIRGIKKFPIKWHTYLAYLTLILGLGHGLMGILSSF